MKSRLSSQLTTMACSISNSQTREQLTSSSSVSPRLSKSSSLTASKETFQARSRQAPFASGLLMKLALRSLEVSLLQSKIQLRPT